MWIVGAFLLHIFTNIRDVGYFPKIFIFGLLTDNQYQGINETSKSPVQLFFLYKQKWFQKQCRHEELFYERSVTSLFL